MRRRRVLLCLPEQPSEDVLMLARTVKAALIAEFQVRLRLSDELDENDDLTPVDGRPNELPLVIRISKDTGSR